VQFEAVAAAGCLVQAVDVLGNDTDQPAGLLPPGEDAMTGVRLGVGEIVEGRLLHPPIVHPGLMAGQELVEIYDPKPGPDATRAAKVGNAAFGTHARTSKGHGTSGFGQVVGKLLDPLIHGRALYRRARPGKDAQ